MRKRNASSAERWTNCPGSLDLELQAPRFEGNKYTEEGTIAHELIERWGKTGVKPSFPNAEMESAGHVWIDDYVTPIRKNGILLERIEVKYRSRKIPGLSGIIDYLALSLDADNVVLDVCDFKYGAGKAVSSEGNAQLFSYFALADEVFRGTIDEFRGTIVQPRSFEDAGIKTTTYTREEVEEWVENVHKNLDSKALNPGDHCDWCPARAICPELRRLSLALAREEFADADDELLELFKATGAIKKFLDDIPAQLIKRIERGEKIPGYKVVDGKGHRAWTKPPEEVAKALGVEPDSISERKLFTPAAVERLLKIKRLDDTLTTRPTLGPRLAKESDRRKARSAEEFDDE